MNNPRKSTTGKARSRHLRAVSLYPDWISRSCCKALVVLMIAMCPAMVANATTSVYYIYDSLGRVKEVLYPTERVVYNYDSAGNRTSTTITNSSVDTDNDGLDSIAEFLNGTDPNNPDSDGDGMLDGWEVGHGFNPLNSADANQDADGDGLTNLQEMQLGTNPHNVDTDGDGLNDNVDPTPNFNPAWMIPIYYLLLN